MSKRTGFVGSGHELTAVQESQYLLAPPVASDSLLPDMIPILSYGMGVESTAILLRFLEEPDTFEFDLSNLIVMCRSLALDIFRKMESLSWTIDAGRTNSLQREPTNLVMSCEAPAWFRPLPDNTHDKLCGI